MTRGDGDGDGDGDDYGDGDKDGGGDGVIGVRVFTGRSGEQDRSIFPSISLFFHLEHRFALVAIHIPLARLRSSCACLIA